MKLAKKILVAVLALALLASCFMFAVTANDEEEVVQNRFSVPGFDDPEDILEYYLDADYFFNDFEDEWYEEDVYWTKGESDYNRALVSGIVEEPDNAGNKVFFGELPYSAQSGYSIANEDFNEKWTDKFFVSFRIYFDESFYSNAYYEVKVGTVGKSALASVLKFDFTASTIKKNGAPVVSYKEWQEAGTEPAQFSNNDVIVPAYNEETGEGFTPETGVWYDVILCYNAEEEVSYFEISTDGEVAYRNEREIRGAQGIWGFDCYARFNNTTDHYQCKSNKKDEHDANVADSTLQPDPNGKKSKYDCQIGECRYTFAAKYYLDNLQVYEGSFERDETKIKEYTEITLAELKAYYNDPAITREEKLSIANALSSLYSLPEETFTAELRAVLPEAYQYINEVYVAELEARAALIDSTAGYYDRVAYVESDINRFYNGLSEDSVIESIEAVVPGITERVAAVKAICETEFSDLADIKAHSDGFIAVINDYDATDKTYQYIVDTYLEAASDKYTRRVADYEGISEAEVIFAELTFKYNRMVDDIRAFNNAVANMQAANAAKNFGAEFAGYVAAYESYNKYGTPGVINPDLDNTTNADIIASLEYYTANRDAVVAKGAECDAFNLKIQEAEAASFYPTLLALLAQADELLVPIWGEAYTVGAAETAEFAYRKDYPGIQASLDLYNALVASTATTTNASEAYVNAVNAIEEAEGFYAKKTAIAAALALKATGDNVAVPGVLEANLALTAAQAEIDILEGYSVTLITLVGKLDAADTFAERRALILQANGIVENTADDYEGVAAAKAALTAEVAAYNSEVNAYNAALANAVANVIALS